MRINKILMKIANKQLCSSILLALTVFLLMLTATAIADSSATCPIDPVEPTVVQ